MNIEKKHLEHGEIEALSEIVSVALKERELFVIYFWLLHCMFGLKTPQQKKGWIREATETRSWLLME